ncbi:HNH endonuclease signature motif containing protein [Nocardioides aestuarii]|uniref:HNH endonuclease n=1 Tax=Nocardioides aestuarii TaxID=252231 RepID=A0ABW4TH59_9ACTN
MFDIVADAVPVTPTGLLARVRATRSAQLRAEAELLVQAAEWADAHPDLGDEPFAATSDPAGLEPGAEALRAFDEERGIPGWSWSAAAPFAAAIGRSTAAGDALIRDALVLRHRLPRLWRRVVAAELEAWRARRIAQLVLGSPDDVCDHLDRELSHLAHRVGATTLARLLDEAMMRLHPEERELDQLAALDQRHVTLHERSINDTGVADMSIRGDWNDLHDFDQTVSAIAARLAALDETEGRHEDSLDVRRSRALGVLADPATARALLDDEDTPSPRKNALLVLHVADDAVTGGNPVARCGTVPMLVSQLRDWLGRTDTHLTVQPVIDLADHTDSTAYESRGRLRTQVELLLPHCVFPWCTREARVCDHDHGVPHVDGGATCDCNLAPLCRRHHRLRTHAGWRYTRLDETTFLWADPHGQQFLSDTTGTRDVTPSDRPVNRGSGCSRAGP